MISDHYKDCAREMQLVLQEILDLLFGESSCGDVDSGGGDQDT